MSPAHLPGPHAPDTSPRMTQSQSCTLGLAAHIFGAVTLHNEFPRGREAAGLVSAGADAMMSQAVYQPLSTSAAPV